MFSVTNALGRLSVGVSGGGGYSRPEPLTLVCRTIRVRCELCYAPVLLSLSNAVVSE